jgi:hypothetical protein
MTAKFVGWLKALPLALLAFLFLVNVYRARTQSITCDEAFTYNQFLDGPASRMFTAYDANHHILHSFLCKLSVRLFGLSELALRAPSLLGGLLYFLALYRLSRYVFGAGGTFLLSVASLSLNPFILDLLSAARGYGLALAFWTWAVYCLVRYLSEFHDPGRADPEPALLIKAALSLGLSVAANLTFLFPAAALGVMLASILLLDGARSGRRVSLQRQRSLVAHCFYLPGILTAFPIIALPISNAGMEHFYVGAQSLAETARSLAGVSLLHHTDLWGGARSLRIAAAAVSIIAKLAAPLVLAISTAVGLQIGCGWIRVRCFRKLGLGDQFLFLVAGTALLALAAAAALHHFWGVPYPITRTGLYWIVLFVFMLLGLARKISQLRIPIVIFLTLCVAWFAVEFNTNYYAEWRYDAGTRRIVRLLRDRQAIAPDRKLRVGITWYLEPSMKFYRRLDALDWMEVVDLRREQNALDYFVVVGDDLALLKTRGLVPLYTDRISQEVLAAPAAEGSK